MRSAATNTTRLPNISLGVFFPDPAGSKNRAGSRLPGRRGAKEESAPLVGHSPREGIKLGRPIRRTIAPAVTLRRLILSPKPTDELDTRSDLPLSCCRSAQESAGPEAAMFAPSAGPDGDPTAREASAVPTTRTIRQSVRTVAPKAR